MRSSTLLYAFVCCGASRNDLARTVFMLPMSVKDSGLGGALTTLAIIGGIGYLFYRKFWSPDAGELKGRSDRQAVLCNGRYRRFPPLL